MMQKTPSPDFEAIFAALPHPCMVLDSNLTIVATTDAYLAATGVVRREMIGRPVFDVFPENPSAPDARPIENTTASFQRVLDTKQTDHMPVQRFDTTVSHPGRLASDPLQYVERYWLPTNIPVFAASGRVEWILHCVTDVTAETRVRLRPRRGGVFSPAQKAMVDRLRSMSPILRDLDDRLFNLLAEHLTPTVVMPGQVLVEAFEPSTAVYFMLDGLVSTCRRLEDGTSAEVAMGSRAGMVGVHLVVGVDPPSFEKKVHVGGVGLRLSADTLRLLMAENPTLRPALARGSVPVVLAQMGIAAACNARHSLDQRLARWLIAARECVGSTCLAVQQDVVAMMLGVRRTGVSEALRRFADAGLVATGRNRIELLDLRRLEATACECHRDLAKELEAAGIDISLAPLDADALHAIMSQNPFP